MIKRKIQNMIKQQNTKCDIDLSEEETGAQLQVLIALSWFQKMFIIIKFIQIYMSGLSIVLYTSAALLMVRLSKSWARQDQILIIGITSLTSASLPNSLP